MKNPLIKIFIFILINITFHQSSKALEIFFTSGDTDTAFIVDVQDATFQTFSLDNGSFNGSSENNGYPLVVINNEILISTRNGLATNTYSLSGTFLGTNYYSGNANFDQLLDGTTDGTKNYAVRCCFGNEVIVADLDWQNPQSLFNITEGGSGIAYDSRYRSLWVLDFNGEFINYSLTGEVISRFTLPRASNKSGLAYDARTGTLWFLDTDNSSVYNISTTGTVISETIIEGLSGSHNIFGGEIAFMPFSSPGDSMLSMSHNAFALRNAFNLQSAKTAQGLTYDCTVFDKNNICVSFAGTRSFGNDGIDNTTGALIIAHRPSANIRVGAYVDQNIGTSDSNGLKVKRGSPGYGLFGVWSQQTDGLGTQVRASVNSGSVDIETTRQAIETAEAGFGQSNIKSLGAQIELSHGFAASNDITVRPYLGYRKMSHKRAAYTEQSSDTVSSPFAYTALKQNTDSILVGVRFIGKLTAQTSATLSTGFEHNVKSTIDDYQAINTDIGTIPTISMGDNWMRKTRPTASLGVIHNIDKKQTVGLSVTHRKEAFQTGSITSGMLQYTAGF